MRRIQHLLIAGAIILSGFIYATAQTENDLKRYFEGSRVEVKIEMPASSGGVNVYPERDQTLDLGHYRSLLKKHGVGVREGERIMITKIKVKDEHIEFQLGGGGYGTFGDETTAYVYVPSADKSRREKNLERDIKNETDKKRLRRMREELDYLRQERRMEDNRNRAAAATAEELKQRRIEEKRLQGGSRFNIRFDRKLSSRDLTPEAVMEALSEYVDF